MVEFHRRYLALALHKDIDKWSPKIPAGVSSGLPREFLLSVVDKR
jgi:hypothetical protein